MAQLAAGRCQRRLAVAKTVFAALVEEIPAKTSFLCSTGRRHLCVSPFVRATSEVGASLQRRRGAPQQYLSALTQHEAHASVKTIREDASGQFATNARAGPDASAAGSIADSGSADDAVDKACLLVSAGQPAERVQAARICLDMLAGINGRELLGTLSIYGLMRVAEVAATGRWMAEPPAPGKKTSAAHALAELPLTPADTAALRVSSAEASSRIADVLAARAFQLRSREALSLWFEAAAALLGAHSRSAALSGGQMRRVSAADDDDSVPLRLLQLHPAPDRSLLSLLSAPICALLAQASSIVAGVPALRELTSGGARPNEAVDMGAKATSALPELPEPPAAALHSYAAEAHGGQLSHLTAATRCLFLVRSASAAANTRAFDAAARGLLADVIAADPALLQWGASAELAASALGVRARAPAPAAVATPPLPTAPAATLAPDQQPASMPSPYSSPWWPPAAAMPGAPAPAPAPSASAAGPAPAFPSQPYWQLGWIPTPAAAAAAWAAPVAAPAAAAPAAATALQPGPTALPPAAPATAPATAAGTDVLLDWTGFSDTPALTAADALGPMPDAPLVKRVSGAAAASRTAAVSPSADANNPGDVVARAAAAVSPPAPHTSASADRRRKSAPAPVEDVSVAANWSPADVETTAAPKFARLGASAVAPSLRSTADTAGAHSGASGLSALLAAVPAQVSTSAPLHSGATGAGRPVTAPKFVEMSTAASPNPRRRGAGGGRAAFSTLAAPHASSASATPLWSAATPEPAPTAAASPLRPPLHRALHSLQLLNAVYTLRLPSSAARREAVSAVATALLRAVLDGALAGVGASDALAVISELARLQAGLQIPLAPFAAPLQPALLQCVDAAASSKGAGFESSSTGSTGTPSSSGASLVKPSLSLSRGHVAFPPLDLPGVGSVLVLLARANAVDGAVLAAFMRKSTASMEVELAAAADRMATHRYDSRESAVGHAAAGGPPPTAVRPQLSVNNTSVAPAVDAAASPQEASRRAAATLMSSLSAISGLSRAMLAQTPIGAAAGDATAFAPAASSSASRGASPLGSRGLGGVRRLHTAAAAAMASRSARSRTGHAAAADAVLAPQLLPALPLPDAAPLFSASPASDDGQGMLEADAASADDSWALAPPHASAWDAPIEASSQPATAAAEPGWGWAAAAPDAVDAVDAMDAMALHSVDALDLLMQPESELTADAEAAMEPQQQPEAQLAPPPSAGLPAQFRPSATSTTSQSVPSVAATSAAGNAADAAAAAVAAADAAVRGWDIPPAASRARRVEKLQAGEPSAAAALPTGTETADRPAENAQAAAGLRLQIMHSFSGAVAMNVLTLLQDDGAPAQLPAAEVRRTVLVALQALGSSLRVVRSVASQQISRRRFDPAVALSTSAQLPVQVRRLELVADALQVVAKVAALFPEPAVARAALAATAPARHLLADELAPLSSVPLQQLRALLRLPANKSVVAALAKVQSFAMWAASAGLVPLPLPLPSPAGATAALAASGASGAPGAAGADGRPPRVWVDPADPWRACYRVMSDSGAPVIASKLLALPAWLLHAVLAARIETVLASMRTQDRQAKRGRGASTPTRKHQSLRPTFADIVMEAASELCALRGLPLPEQRYIVESCAVPVAAAWPRLRIAIVAHGAGSFATGEPEPAGTSSSGDRHRHHDDNDDAAGDAADEADAAGAASARSSDYALRRLSASAVLQSQALQAAGWLVVPVTRHDLPPPLPRAHWFDYERRDADAAAAAAVVDRLLAAGGVWPRLVGAAFGVKASGGQGAAGSSPGTAAAAAAAEPATSLPYGSRRLA